MSELIPVIHMLNEEQVFANVDVCLANDIKKVFLINHNVTEDELYNCATKIKDRIWTGVNFLGRPIEDTVTYTFPFEGLWCDRTLNSGLAKQRAYKGLLFTSLAFKYQAQPKDLKIACEVAIKSTDVATTSGTGTGKAADVEKIIKMREYLGNHPLAIASGVSASNVHLYKDLADYLLVASSITDHNEMIVEDKLKALRDKL